MRILLILFLFTSTLYLFSKDINTCGLNIFGDKEGCWTQSDYAKMEPQRERLINADYKGLEGIRPYRDSEYIGHRLRKLWNGADSVKISPPVFHYLNASSERITRKSFLSMLPKELGALKDTEFSFKVHFLDSDILCLHERDLHPIMYSFLPNLDSLYKRKTSQLPPFIISFNFYSNLYYSSIPKIEILEEGISSNPFFEFDAKGNYESYDWMIAASFGGYDIISVQTAQGEVVLTYTLRINIDGCYNNPKKLRIHNGSPYGYPLLSILYRLNVTLGSRGAVVEIKNLSKEFAWHRYE